MAKYIIDAGHGGSDPGAVYEGRREKDDNLRLALAVGRLLEDGGAEIVYTRTEDVYQTPFEKAQTANQLGGDYFLSFHRNSSAEPNRYSGAETLVYDRSGKKLELAEAINRELEAAGYQNLGVKERPGLAVLRKTRMPALLIETGFLNTDADNALFDREFDALAQGIARGILSASGDETPPREPEPEGEENAPEEKLYRVQVGAYRNREYAEALLSQLQQEGYPAFILKEDGYYKVQAGAFRALDNAVRLEGELRRKGYSTFLVS